MANTYKSHGYINLVKSEFTTDLNEATHQTELAHPYLEVTTGNGTVIRLVGRQLSLNYDGKISLTYEKYTEEDTDDWAKGITSESRSTRGEYINASGEEIDKSEAIGDDLDNEYVDGEGNSFDPKMYKQTLVNGANNKFDSFIKDIYKDSVNTVAESVFKSFADILGVTLP